MTDQTKGRKQLLMLFAIAFVPLFIAYGTYFYLPSLMPTDTTNEGVLIDPPLAGEPAEQWRMLVVLPANCDDACRDVLYQSRQVHTALGKESERVVRELIARQPPDQTLLDHLAESHKTAILRVAPELAELLEDVDKRANLVFIKDPFGNIMMYFPPEKSGKPMLKDLKHLLRVSNIG